MKTSPSNKTSASAPCGEPRRMLASSLCRLYTQDACKTKGKKEAGRTRPFVSWFPLRHIKAPLSLISHWQVWGVSRTLSSSAVFNLGSSVSPNLLRSKCSSIGSSLGLGSYESKSALKKRPRRGAFRLNFAKKVAPHRNRKADRNPAEQRGHRTSFGQGRQERRWGCEMRESIFVAVFTNCFSPPKKYHPLGSY